MRSSLPEQRVVTTQTRLSMTGISKRFGGVQAIRQAEFHLLPGEVHALVGENGAGKSTLIKLLLGLYQPTTGRILVDGVDLSEMTIQEWRDQLAVVFQDFARYSFTVQENIGFGDLQHLDDMAAIQAAAEKSEVAEAIEALPSRYDTMLGKEFAGGQELSQGQWQKLAIARAYLRDAPIVVLDEPTAALDPLAEVEVYRQFQEMSQGKTLLLISHRLGSARLADRILVMHHGQIVEDGTHKQLMARETLYHHLFSTQSHWYEN